MSSRRKHPKVKDFSLASMIHERIMALPKEQKNKSPYIRSNIPPEYWDLDLRNFKGNKRTVKLVKKYVDKLNEAYKAGIGFLFTGTNGVGKTSMQMIILKAAIKNGYSAFHITLPEIFHYIKLGFDDPKLLLEIHQILRETDFLAVSELGKDYHRKGSELFMRSEFDMIFRY